jgi:hypothetical protein
MNKKAKKLLGVILTLAMILTLGTVTAFAEGTVIENPDMTAIGLSKTLQVADGITGYPADYTFSFTAVGSDTAAAGDHKTIADQTVTVGTQNNDEATGVLDFDAIFGAATTFPHAGEYVYSVKETTAASTTTENGVTKTLTVDDAEYNVHLFIANGDNGLEYAAVTVWTVVNGEEEEKVDPTIITNNNENEVSGFNFTNKYTEVIEGAVLTVTKTITGAYADKTKEFPVTVTLTIPSTATADDVAVAEGTVSGTAPTLTVTANLADNGTIAFTKLPAGTTFVVAETQDSAYMSKTTGYVANEDTEYVAGDVSKDGKAPITAAGNEVSIENNREDTVPTGVIIESLPYVLLAVIAAAGVVYLTLKKKARG